MSINPLDPSGEVNPVIDEEMIAQAVKETIVTAGEQLKHLASEEQALLANEIKHHWKKLEDSSLRAGESTDEEIKEDRLSKFTMEIVAKPLHSILSDDPDLFAKIVLIAKKGGLHNDQPDETIFLRFLGAVAYPHAKELLEMLDKALGEDSVNAALN